MSRAGSRVFYLDAVRSTLMLMVVVVHAGAVYAHDSHWLVTAGEGRHWITALVDFIGLFDVEGFFVISGIFTVMMAARHGSAALWDRRLGRLVVPLVSSALILNLPLSLWLHRTGASDEAVFSLAYLAGGGWVYHLWFLVNLVLYTVIMRLCLPLLLPLARRIEPTVDALQGRLFPGLRVMVLLSAVATAQLCLVALSHALPVMYTELPFGSSLYSFLHHFMFFLLGVTLGAFPTLLSSFTRPSAPLYGAAIALVLLDLSVAGPAYLDLFISNLMAAFVAFSLIQALFTLFSAYLDRPSGLWQHLSGASYSVYLVHHPIVVLLALWMVTKGWPAEVAFPLLLAAAFLLSWLIHVLLIDRSAMLAFLFNGKTGPHESETPPIRPTP